MIRRFLCMCCLVSVCGAFTSSRGYAGDAKKYLLDESTILVSVNVKKYFDAPIVKQHLPAFLAEVAKDRELGKLLKIVRVNLDRAYVCMSMSKNKEKTLVVGQGKWDMSKYEESLRQLAKEYKVEEVKKTTIGDMVVHQVRDMYLAVPEEGVIVVASTLDEMKVVQAKKAGTKKTRLRKEMDALLVKVDPKHSLSLAAFGSITLVEDKPYRILATVEVNENIDSTVTVELETPKDAEVMRESAKLGIQWSLEEAKDLPPSVRLFLSKTKVTAKGNIVTGKTVVTGKELAGVLK